MYHQPLPVQVQPVKQPRTNGVNGVNGTNGVNGAAPKQVPLKIIDNKLSSVQLAIIGSFLFFIFANPEIFSFVNKILPGVIMNYAGKVTQSGTITHAIVFGVIFFIIIYLLQRPSVEGYKKYRY